MPFLIFFGIRLPGKPFKRVKYTLSEDEYATSTIAYLKTVVRELLMENYQSESGLELIYGGSILEDVIELKQLDIKSGSTIHVFERAPKPEATIISATKKDLENALESFDYLRSFLDTHKLPETLGPTVLDKILEKYPEIRNDPPTFSLLMDPKILLYMFQEQQIHILSQKCPILIRASKFIVETVIDVRIEKLSQPRWYVHSPVRTQGSQWNSSASDSCFAPPSPTSSAVESLHSLSLNDPISPLQLSNALLSANTTSTSPSAIVEAQPQLYVTELEMMREMGLEVEHKNLQALILCNGNVEDAVNLVMGIQKIY